MNTLANTLPISASRLQRDLDQVIGPQPQTLETVASIPGIKYNPPDFMLPWLIWEYGLEQLLPYLSDPRLAIQEGVRWQRIRGTPTSLAMAFGWLGLADIAIEPEVPGKHFYQYQVDTGRTVLATELDNVRAVARFSAPLRSRLSRLYHDYDVRRVVLDESDYGALLSDYSGVRKDGLVLSFGRSHHCGTNLDPVEVGFGLVSSRTARVVDVHWPTLDGGTFDDILGGVLTQSRRLNEWAVDSSLEGQPWLGHWDERSWGDSTYPLIATRNTALHTRQHDNDFVFDTPTTQITISYTFTGVATLNTVTANMTLTQGRQIELAEPPATHLADSVRFNVQAVDVSPHGQSWLGHWDTRAWNKADYSPIGLQNNALITRYYDSGITWPATDLGTGLTSIYSGELTLNSVAINAKLTVIRDVQVSNNYLLSNHLDDSVRMADRAIDITLQGQYWQGYWDKRIWDTSEYLLIGVGYMARS